MMRRFEGWYFKQQNARQTLALIPGISNDGAFVQIITDSGSHNVKYPQKDYRKTDKLYIGDSSFSKKGVSLSIRDIGITMTGELAYKNLIPIKGDIMGPFRFFPMECRHGIVSMRHTVNGEVTLNGEPFVFDCGVGYIESDSGRSFPQSYTWVHGNDLERECSIMASVARIPFAGINFQGCIAALLLDGREYRLATYKGVHIRRRELGFLELVQGKYRLEVSVENRTGEPLYAPNIGSMSRIIRENASCPAWFRFSEGGTCLFEGDMLAGYEYDI